MNGKLLKKMEVVDHGEMNSSDTGKLIWKWSPLMLQTPKADQGVQVEWNSQGMPTAKENQMKNKQQNVPEEPKSRSVQSEGEPDEQHARVVMEEHNSPIRQRILGRFKWCWQLIRAKQTSNQGQVQLKNGDEYPKEHKVVVDDEIE